MEGPLNLRGVRLGRIIKAIWRRGRSGSGAWFGVATVFTMLKILRALSRPKRDVAFSLELKPGEGLKVFDAGVREGASRQ